MRRIPLCAFAAVLIASPVRAKSPDVRVDTVARLEFPIGMAFTASGDRLFVNERSGRIRVIEDGRLLPRAFATVDTTTSGEGGLLGLALDPKFEEGEEWVYVFYTRPGGGSDRVERIHADGRRAVLMRALPSGSPYHHGGILAFGPDGKLYVSHGEAHDQQRAQQPRELGGKIYRINPDGSIPDDNPFAGEPTWSYGHRNPFGLAFDPANGSLWETENGPDAHDEINRIARGENYGWPIARGKAGDDRFVDPVVDYERIVVPTGLAFAPDSFGAEYARDLFVGTFGQRAIRRLRLDGARERVTSDTVFLAIPGGVTALARGPDGLYAATPDAVLRLRAQPAPSPSASASPSPTVSPSATGTTTGPFGDETQGRIQGFLVITTAAVAGYALSRWVRDRINRRRARP